MGLKGKFSIGAVLLFLIVGFQNCSLNSAPVAFTDSNKISNETDSGTPYEGKIYATLGNVCGDGSEIHSRIVLSSPTKAELNRENCADIAPKQLTSADFEVSSNADTLIYQNQSFQYIGTGSFGITNFSISNDVNNFYYSYTYEGTPSWLQIYLDTDNNPATGFSFNGIGAEFMIENDNVWKYSAPAGSPQTTWSWSSLVSANKNNVAPNISWSFSRNAIGSPALIKVVGHTSFGSRTDIITQIPK